MKGFCKAPGCNREVYAKELCTKHYNRFRKKGTYLDKDLKNDAHLTIKERLEKNKIVTQHGCFIWQKQLDVDGYGVISVKNKPHRVHRVAYEEYIGPIPEGMLICHTCDNPSCFNPDHLFLGTSQDNLSDMVNKGRKPKGEKTYNAKLTEEQARQAKIRYLQGERVADIAKDFNVHGNAIRLIGKGINWKHIKI